MIDRIDSIIGDLRTAELINERRRQLRDQDLLSDRSALSAACTAYADGYIYAVVAAGQIWKRIATSESEAQEVQIIEVGANSTYGHYAVCREQCGIIVNIPVDELDAQFSLVRWPTPEGTF